MSLIQEALKRQQQEQEGTLPPPPSTNAAPQQELAPPYPPTRSLGLRVPESAPASTAPTQVTATKPAMKRRAPKSESSPAPAVKQSTPEPVESNPQEKQSTRVWPTILGFGLVLILLISALVWALVYGIKLVSTRHHKDIQIAQQETIPQGIATQHQPTEQLQVEPLATATTGPKPVTPRNQVQKALQSVATETPDEAQAEQTPSEAVTEASSIAETQPVSNGTESDENQSPATTEVAEDVAVTATMQVANTVPESIIWPEITISGVVGREQKGAAFINGKVIGINETVQDIRILAIKPQGALLEYKGETRFAKVGQPIKNSVVK